jgi:hypothetical protein
MEKGSHNIFILSEKRDVELRMVQKLRNDGLHKLYSTPNILGVPTAVRKIRVLVGANCV